ncbi:helix-turn-helix domain-containing protein [Frisingicoccus sp.]|uniref:helix-turn-helix domain-containing protein n=1 Tax=Frisingicoccus sp. TaxID=1918627 RepID=UPI0025C12B0E|nr:helix-turn-helix transcriptional regulator [Frisingicoccus sp.]
MERPYFDIVASGRRMRDIRKARKISVRQVMEYMGFESTQAVYKWEAGRCYPQADNLLALAKLYNVSPMELLVEEDSLSSSCRLWRKRVINRVNHWLLDNKKKC